MFGSRNRAGSDGKGVEKKIRVSSWVAVPQILNPRTSSSQGLPGHGVHNQPSPEKRVSLLENAGCTKLGIQHI
jgi:hypothetical protein